MGGDGALALAASGAWPRRGRLQVVGLEQREGGGERVGGSGGGGGGAAADGGADAL